MVYRDLRDSNRLWRSWPGKNRFLTTIAVVHTLTLFVKYLHEVDSKAYVIVLASSGQADDVHKAIKLGVKGYLRKPYSFDNMEQYLKKYHSQAPSHKRVYAE